MFHQSIFVGFGHDFYQILKPARPDDVVSVENAVTADVSDGPDSLLDNAWVVGLEQLDEERNSALVDDALALDGGSGSYVGESPGSLKLELRVLLLFNVLDHAGNKAGIDDGLDGWGISDGEDFSDSDHTVVLFDDVGFTNRLDQIGKDFDRVVRPQETT